MKEQIYTIPINEAMDAETECPFCMLLKRCEEEAVDYALGAAMMEPDHRIESNEKGYCNRHFEMMFRRPNKLSLALLMETHIAENEKQLEKFAGAVKTLKTDKKGFFRKSDSKQIAAELAEVLKKREDSCMICDKINHTMSRYISVFADMWRTEQDFAEKVRKSKGFCMPHTRMLLEAADKLPDRDRADFTAFLYEKQTEEFARIKDDIHRFTLKFDYRNKDMEWGGAEDAPRRSIEKTAGFIGTDE